jgi:hypothetical protein
LPFWDLQKAPFVFPWQRESLQLPHARAALSLGAGSNDGSFALSQPAEPGAEKIAARVAFAGPAGVAVWAAPAREAISGSRAKAKNVDLSFMQFSFERVHDEPSRWQQAPLKKKVPELRLQEPRACISAPPTPPSVRPRAAGGPGCLEG